MWSLGLYTLGFQPRGPGAKLCPSACADLVFLTSDTQCMVSRPSQLSSVPRSARPSWVKGSAAASFFCWPGGVKSR